MLSRRVLKDSRDWERLMANPDMAVRAINQFFQEPLNDPDYSIERVQESMVVPYTTPELVASRDYAKTTVATPDYDFGWQLCYDMVDPSRVVGGYLEVHTLGHNITFEKVMPGGKMKVYSLTGSESLVYVPPYAAAIKLSKDWITDQRYYKFDDALGLQRDEYYQTQATAMYDLLHAAALSVAFISTVGETLDACVVSIVGSCKNTGVKVNANSTFLIITPWNLRNKVLDALAPSQELSPTGYKPKPNYQVIVTQALTTTTKPVVVLPGQGITGVEYVPYSVAKEYQVLERGWLAGADGRYVGIVNANQCRKCTMS